MQFLQNIIEVLFVANIPTDGNILKLSIRVGEVYWI